MEIQYASAHLPAIFYDASPFDFVCFLAKTERAQKKQKKLAGTGRNVSSYENAFLRDRISAKHKISNDIGCALFFGFSSAINTTKRVLQILAEWQSKYLPWHMTSFAASYVSADFEEAIGFVINRKQ